MHSMVDEVLELVVIAIPPKAGHPCFRVLLNKYASLIILVHELNTFIITAFMPERGERVRYYRWNRVDTHVQLCARVPCP